MVKAVFWEGAFCWSGDVFSNDKAIIENQLQNHNERRCCGGTDRPDFWLDVVKKNPAKSIYLFEV
jgi:hypothetical protein